MALAEIEDLEARLGRTLDDATRAQALLDGAEAAVISYTGQSFELAETTVRLKVKRGWVKLPQRPVVDVTAVEDVNGNSVTFEWLMGDRVKLTLSRPDLSFAFEPWHSGLTVVDVTYEHGYSTIPADIVEVVCQIAGRAFGVTPDDTAINQETLGSYNYSTGAAAVSGALGMLAPERAVLDRYRRVGGTVSVDR